MLTLLLSALIATAPVAVEITAQADTVNQYFIDGKSIPNFDGSQLVGLSIADYDISVSKEKGKVVRKHTITSERNRTSNPPLRNVQISSGSGSGDSIAITGLSSEDEKNVIWIVNDERVDKEKVNSIKQSNVKSISVLRGKAAETIYGEEAGSGVVIIQVK